MPTSMILLITTTSDDGAGVGGGAPPQPLLHIRIRLDPQHPTCDRRGAAAHNHLKGTYVLR